KIGEAVKVAENFAVEVRVGEHKRSDATFGAAAGGSGNVERGGGQGFAGNGPVLEFAKPIFFQVIHNCREPIGHGHTRELESVLLIALQIFVSGRELT